MAAATMAASSSSSASSSSLLLAALSASGSHVAVVVPSNVNNASLLRIQVFQTQTGTLQTTLMHRHNNNNYNTTVVAAGGGGGGSGGAPVEIFWAGNDKICLLTTSGTLHRQVLVFDLTRGVLAHTIPAAAPNQTLHHAASATCTAARGGVSPIIQVLVSSSSTTESGERKIQIHEYDAASGKLLRKIKAGSRRHYDVDGDNKNNQAAALGLAVTSDFIIVREGNQLRILKSDTGEKVTKKCKLFKKGGDDSAVAGTTTTTTTTVAVGQLGAAVVSAARQVVLVNLNTGKVIAPSSTSLPVSSNSSSRPILHLWETTTTSDESSSLYYYLHHDQALYQLELSSSDKDDTDGGKKQVVEVKSRRKIQTNTSIEKQAVLGHGDDMIAILYKAGQIQLNMISLVSGSKQQQDVVALTWNDPASADNAAAAASTNTKRKSTSGTAQVLGPGQAGGEARTVSEGGSAPKRAKKDGDDDDDDMKEIGDGGDDDEDEDEDNQGPTIAERLQKLEQALHAEEEQDDDANEDSAQEDKATTNNAIKFHPKKATTESLTLVLEQALQSNDKAMLELALTVTNKSILQATCESLPTESLIQLLSALTTRLAQKPTRAVQLSAWLTVVLKSGRIVQNSNNTNYMGQLLQPLRNLLEERVELFPTFYKLRGRLGMMGNLQE